jgi:hypothetical protein
MRFEQVEEFYKTATIPKGPIKLNKWSTIEDPQKFVDFHLNAIRKHRGVRTYLPYFERLVEFMEYLKNN